MAKPNQILVVVKGLIFNEGKILLVKRSEEEVVGGGTWELVGGKIEFGEDLETGLLREIKEEVGLNVTIGKILFTTTFFTDPTRQIILLTYLCRSLTKTITLSSEHNDYRWATKEDAQLRLSPEILKDFEKNNILTLEGFQ